MPNEQGCKRVRTRCWSYQTASRRFVHSNPDPQGVQAISSNNAHVDSMFQWAARKIALSEQNLYSVDRRRRKG